MPTPNDKASAPTPQAHPKPKSPQITVLFLVLFALMLFLGFHLQGGGNLLAVTALLLLSFLGLGKLVTGEWLGFLINSQNVMSLSRFQMVLWTLVVLASFLCYVLMRIRCQLLQDPLAITLDPTLLSLMGISTASLVGSPMLLDNKREKTPTELALQRAADRADQKLEQIDGNRQGTLYANTNLGEARLTDLFQGDELGNTDHIDLAKVQMFFFTLIGALAYLVLVYRALQAAEVSNGSAREQLLTSMPPLSTGLVTLIGISHAGYLTSKGIDHTPLQPR